MEHRRAQQEIVQVGQHVWMKRAIPLVPTGQSAGRFLPRIPFGTSEIEGVLLYIHDLTFEWQREQELKIKSAMLQETHHRVKNNLQTIASFLRMQARRSSSAEVAELIDDSISRILSIALVHDSLAHADDEVIDLKDVIQRIVSHVSQTTIGPMKRISVNIMGDGIPVTGHQATSCALVVNELLLNAIEHGLADETEGSIDITLTERAGDVSLEIIDSGLGISPGLELEAHGDGLGLQIVRTLVRDDLHGVFRLEASNGRGTRAFVSFPRASPAIM